MTRTRSTFRLLTAVALAAGVVGAAQAGAASGHGARKVKTFTFNYAASTSEHAGTPLGGSLQACFTSSACMQLTLPSWARYTTVTSADASGRPTPISMFPNTGKSGLATETFVCGSAKNLPGLGNTSWNLSVDAVSSDPGCPSVATTGTVKITVSNKR